MPWNISEVNKRANPGTQRVTELKSRDGILSVFTNGPFLALVYIYSGHIGSGSEAVTKAFGAPLFLGGIWEVSRSSVSEIVLWTMIGFSIFAGAFVKNYRISDIQDDSPSNVDFSIRNFERKKFFAISVVFSIVLIFARYIYVAYPEI